MLVEVELERHERHALGAQLRVDEGNLSAVHEQAPPAVRIHVPHATVRVRVYVHTHQKGLAASDDAKRVAYLTGTLAYALDLGSRELDASLPGLTYLVVVTGDSVLRDAPFLWALVFLAPVAPAGW